MALHLHVNAPVRIAVYNGQACPRNILSLEEKYNYTMELGDEEVNKILEKHEECFNKRIKDSVQK